MKLNTRITRYTNNLTFILAHGINPKWSIMPHSTYVVFQEVDFELNKCQKITFLQ